MRGESTHACGVPALMIRGLGSYMPFPVGGSRSRLVWQSSKVNGKDPGADSSAVQTLERVQARVCSVIPVCQICKLHGVHRGCNCLRWNKVKHMVMLRGP